MATIEELQKQLDAAKAAAAEPATDAPPPNVTPFYLDKGLWVAVLAPLFVLLNQKFGLALDPVVIVGFLLPLAGFVVGHKWKTGTLAAADKAAAAAITIAKLKSPGDALAEPPKP